MAPRNEGAEGVGPRALLAWRCPDNQITRLLKKGGEGRVTSTRARGAKRAHSRASRAVCGKVFLVF